MRAPDTNCHAMPRIVTVFFVRAKAGFDGLFCFSLHLDLVRPFGFLVPWGVVSKNAVRVRIGIRGSWRR